jgi:hypothetical protein
MTVTSSSGRFGFRPTELGFSVVILTGACRSGKTSLGQLLATLEHTDHVEEPWLPLTLPSLVQTELVDREVARALLRAAVHELQNHTVLLRGANLRPSDDSSVWQTKSAEEIFDRLHGLRTRADVRAYNAEHRPVLVLNLAETQASARFFVEALPEARVIHVVRDGREVAHEMMKKSWYSSAELARPLNNQVYRRYVPAGGAAPVYLPWWLPEDRSEAFLAGSPWARAVMYWTWVMTSGADELDALAAERPDALLQVRYDELLARPLDIAGDLAERLGVAPGPRTRELADGLAARERLIVAVPDDETLAAEDVERFKEMRARYGF